ncbi:UDP-glucose--hexose-1-phosphate uridylyltransferase [Paenibacillus sp. 32O-W]|uniref:UDP-glucose--hexose-1-phosphate uridylyltransferase n=1 Tax=Paenibacillus sp. 32O-W TaxID=1695218 RepID=UPI0011AA5224|nr:UDP-glucose--hexose-1-phosphate uridylyltransferase [Paenibacillus sp. 32O-W]
MHNNNGHISKTEAAQWLARLVRFGEAKGLIEEEDRIPVTNALLDLLQIEEPCDGDLDTLFPPEEDLAGDSPMPLLNPLLDYAAGQGLLSDNTVTYRDLLDARMMGLLMPRQSEIIREFSRLLEQKGPEAATHWFYSLSKHSNYIRMDRIRQNEYWQASTDYGDLEITINLSKPEKDPKQIALERSMPQSRYPKCLLCAENVGYAGRVNHPARQNHRIIPVKLAGQSWFFQYSPYVYYNEHCIILSGQHVPMKLTKDTFIRLAEFTEQFPHYFIGSNADLPIVGGSILSHDHFQGGRHRFAMEVAAREEEFVHPRYPGIRAAIVKWPMSVIRISGPNSGELTDLAYTLLEVWRGYSDESADILAFSREEDGTLTPHNTITPIARRNAQGEWEFDLVLRNNRTSPEHPLGIFHPHRELHHIKKENIGLIEVMGLAVLPGRLQQELRMISGILSGQAPVAEWPEGHPLQPHQAWIRQLAQEHGTRMSEAEAAAVLRQEVGRKYMQVLEDAGVFKRNSAGKDAFRSFMFHAGFVLR